MLELYIHPHDKNDSNDLVTFNNTGSLLVYPGSRIIHQNFTTILEANQNYPLIKNMIDESLQPPQIKLVQ